MVAYVKHALARPNARVRPEADVMHMFDGRRIADAVNLPRLLLDNDGQQLHLVLPSRGLCVLNNLPAAAAQATRSRHGRSAAKLAAPCRGAGQTSSNVTVASRQLPGRVSHTHLYRQHTLWALCDVHPVKVEQAGACCSVAIDEGLTTGAPRLTPGR